MAFYATTSTTEGVIVIHCSGAIVLGGELTSLRVLVKDLLSKSHHIMLDLRDVTHIDSSSLGTLVALCTSARKLHGDIKLVNLGSRVNNLLQITKLVTAFEVFDKAEDAVPFFNTVPAAT